MNRGRPKNSTTKRFETLAAKDLRVPVGTLHNALENAIHKADVGVTSFILNNIKFVPSNGLFWKSIREVTWERVHPSKDSDEVSRNFEIARMMVHSVADNWTPNVALEALPRRKK